MFSHLVLTLFFSFIIGISFLTVAKSEPNLDPPPSPPLLTEENYADKILLHVIGDAFGTKSGLEGLAGAEHIRYRADLLEKFLTNI